LTLAGLLGPGCLLLPSNSRVTKIMFSHLKPPPSHPRPRPVQWRTRVFSVYMYARVGTRPRPNETIPVDPRCSSWGGAWPGHFAHTGRATTQLVICRKPSSKARAEHKARPKRGKFNRAGCRNQQRKPLAKGHIRKAPSPLFVRSRGDARPDCQGFTCSRLERGAHTGVA
jgi:hypothetical protein